MAFAEVGTHYGNVIVVNEGSKPSSKNINGNSCPEISQKIWRLSPSSNKTVVEKLQTLQCSETRKYSADAVSVPKWEVCGFFWQPPDCVGGVHTAFLKGCSEVEWAPEEACVMGDDALQPCEKAELALLLNASRWPTHAALLCWLSEEMLICSAGRNELLLLSLKIKAELLVTEQKCTSLMVHHKHPFHASPQHRRLCQTSAVLWFKCKAFGRYRVQ